MERLIRVMPYDNNTPNKYPEVPEFMIPADKNVIYRRQGTYAIGNSDNRFASEGFSACSGLIFRGRQADTFGFFHVLPLQDLYDRDFEQLKPLTNGQVVLVEGSKSSSKSYILADLKRMLEIEHTGTISVDTIRTGVGNMHFHVAFRPKENEILVARNSHQDLLVYSAFD